MSILDTNTTISDPGWGPNPPADWGLPPGGGQIGPLGVILGGLHRRVFVTTETALRTYELLKLIAGKVDIDPAELAAIEEAARVGAAKAVAAERETLIEAVKDAIREAGADNPGGGITEAQIDKALREVFADAATK